MKGIYLIVTPSNQKAVKSTGNLCETYNRFINQTLRIPKSIKEELSERSPFEFEFRVLRTFQKGTPQEVINTYRNLFRDLYEGKGELIKGVPKYTLLENVIERDFSWN